MKNFQGCLTALPAANRTLLELRTGYGDAKPLGPRAAAARLNVDAAQLAQLEQQAVRELTQAASTHSCAQTSEIVSAAVAFIGAGLGQDGQGTAQSGFKDVRFDSAPFRNSGPSPSLVGGILGADIPPVASDLIIVLLLVLLLGGTTVLVVADAAGQGPRHEQWRRRVINRLRALR